MPTQKITPEKILNTAIKQAEKSSWEAVQLNEIAHELKINLADIKKHFRDKEDFVEAWFEKSTEKMLKIATKDGFSKQSTHTKYHQLIMACLKNIGTHHKVSRDMLLTLLKPGHFSAQFHGLSRLRRSVEWIREAAGCKGNYLESTCEKTALSIILLLTLGHWINDHSKDFKNTAEFLDKQLSHTETASHLADHWIYQPCQKVIKSFGFLTH